MSYINRGKHKFALQGTFHTLCFSQKCCPDKVTHGNQ